MGSKRIFRRVLVPIDLSDRNARTLGVALALAQQNHAHVLLFHVVQQVPRLAPAEMRSFYDRLVSTSRRKLARVSRSFVTKGIAVPGDVRIGEPATEIVRAATARRADLIIMGSHKVNPRRRGAGWGTTSYKVGILCRCPILLVK